MHSLHYSIMINDNHMNITQYFVQYSMPRVHKKGSMSPQRYWLVFASLSAVVTAQSGAHILYKLVAAWKLKHFEDVLITVY